MKFKYILVIILIASCTPRQTRDFEFIDFSISHDRAQEHYSLKIFQDGKAYIKSYRGDKYVFTLTEATFDTISLLTKAIINSKLDSVYYTNCLNCINFNLIIKLKERQIHFFHIGDLYKNGKFKLLEDYACYLSRLIDRSMISANSSFVFESWTDSLLPPPPPSTMKVKLINK